VRKSATRVAALLAEEFVEIGSSGRIYDKQQIVDRLQQEQWTGPLSTASDFSARQLAPDLILAIYRIVVRYEAPFGKRRASGSKWCFTRAPGTVSRILEQHHRATPTDA
jgi:hypothetical protein